MKRSKDILILLLFTALVALLFRNTQARRTDPLVSDRAALEDTLKLGRRFDSLSLGMFDLSNELHSRTRDTLLRAAVHQPRPVGVPAGLMPQPIIPTVPRPSEQQVAAAAAQVSATARTGITIRYGDRDVENAAAALKNAGFLVESYARLGEGPTNSLVLGDSVPLEAVRYVSFALLRDGILLRRIRRSSQPGVEPSIISLESVSHLESILPLSIEQIERLTRTAGQRSRS